MDKHIHGTGLHINVLTTLCNTFKPYIFLTIYVSYGTFFSCRNYFHPIQDAIQTVIIKIQKRIRLYMKGVLMMGYINFRVGKLKTASQMGRAQAHNQRTAYCENTDEARRFMNKQIMGCVEDYEEFFKSRVSASPVYQDGRKPRSDAVHALDLEFRVSADEVHNNPFFDIDKFCDETRRWVCRTFGAENVADMILHLDEGYGDQNGELKFAPHIHAIVIPMTKDGRLSAAEYIGTPKKLNEMQTAVADQYKTMRLKRGQEKSVAKHVEMKEYYGWVHSARVVDVPEPMENETGKQYATRIKPEIQKIQSQKLDDFLKLQRERDEALTRVKQLESGINTGEEEVKRAREELRKREDALRIQSVTLQKDYDALQQWKDVLNGLTNEKISENDRQTFLKIAQQALEIGRANRTEKELSDDSVSKSESTNRPEIK